MPVKFVMALLSAGCCAAALSACGSVQTETNTVTETVTATADSAAAAEPDASADDTAATSTSKYHASTKSSGRCVVVPDVVGKDHQLAQDTMQAAGLYMLDEEDATGQGRLLIIDRNWTTVRQKPAAGECVASDTEVMLSAKKDGE